MDDGQISVKDGEAFIKQVGEASFSEFQILTILNTPRR